MTDNLVPKAIRAALSGDWKLAINLNKEILEGDSEDIDALNRIARAYAEIGKIKKAKQYSQKSLKLDPFNKIASSCIKKWEIMKEGNREKPISSYSPKLFIEEVGKTKIVSLINLTSKKIISTLRCADELKLNLLGHRVTVVTIDGKYIGKLPDDVGSRIKRMHHLGYEYCILVKSADTEKVIVFIKQIDPNGTTGEITFPIEKEN
jgi:tetratricopeptide (TPR) repeat protein